MSQGRVRWLQEVVSTNRPKKQQTVPYVDRPDNSNEARGYIDSDGNTFILREKFLTYKDMFSIFDDLKTKEDFIKSSISGIHDRPGRPGRTNVNWKVHTSILFVRENGAEKLLGKVEWGYNIDADGEMTAMPLRKIQ